MTDLATLGIRVESQEVGEADRRLEGLTAAAARAERATDGIAAAARGTAGPLATMNRQIVQQQRSLVMTRGAMGLTTAEGLNMSRQMSDVGVQLAMGMNPFMIAIQQGPQIMDIFSQAAVRTGQTTSQVANQMAAAWLRALWPILPFIAAIAGAAGAVAAAWGLATRKINADATSVQDSLNLTADQMTYLEKRGVNLGVTMGDVWNGIGRTVSRVLHESFGDEVDWASQQWNAFLDRMTSAMHGAARALLAGFLTAYFAIRSTWQTIPAVIGDAAYTAARLATAGMELLINRAIDGLNGLLAKAKALSAVNPLFAPANLIDPFSHISINRPGNPYAGAMSGFNRNVAGSAVRGLAVADDVLASIGRDTLAARDARVGGELEDYKAKADEADRMARGVRKAKEEVEELDKSFDRIDIQPLNVSLERLRTPLDDLVYELEMIDRLTRDIERGLGSAFGRGGDAVGAMLSTLTGYRAQVSRWDQEQRDIRAANVVDVQRLAAIEAERGQAQISVYGDLAAAARGYFAEGSAGYQALLLIEQVFRAQQLAGMLQSIITGQTETTATLAQNTAKTSSFGVMAVVRAIASLPFPLNLAAGAATLAAVVALGASISGGMGGGSSRRSAGAANDNEVDATARVRRASAMSAQGASGQSTTTIRVVPNDDRFAAYVDDRAMPMSTAAYRSSVTASRGIIPAEQARRDRFKLGGRGAYGGR